MGGYNYRNQVCTEDFVPEADGGVCMESPNASMPDHGNAARQEALRASPPRDCSTGPIGCPIGNPIGPVIDPPLNRPNLAPVGNDPTGAQRSFTAETLAAEQLEAARRREAEACVLQEHYEHLLTDEGYCAVRNAADYEEGGMGACIGAQTGLALSRAVGDCDEARADVRKLEAQ